MASEEEEDPEVEFLKSLTTKQKQKLLRWVFYAVVFKYNETFNQLFSLSLNARVSLP